MRKLVDAFLGWTLLAHSFPLTRSAPSPLKRWPDHNVAELARVLLALDQVGLSGTRSNRHWNGRRHASSLMKASIGVKVTLPTKGTGMVKFTPYLDSSEAVVIDLPIPFTIDPKPQGENLVFTEDGDFGIKAGDIMRFITEWKRGLATAENIGGSLAALSGSVPYQVALRDIKQVKGFKQLQEIIDVHEKAAPAQGKVMIIVERPL
eukprot:CAMPEP_0169070518 /NCGR_PEP_ID=MMETSP1015-20121227/5158_1 /TAXON_ID=342587 /ORGANISM="Karlodinium micrum, Strain CCMP2283" /LENGTH=205 /DNA_ID=CAMNT_0009129521 /DNA_START=69 /DNA_END=686 /DNA_ORIENTATION=-